MSTYDCVYVVCVCVWRVRERVKLVNVDVKGARSGGRRFVIEIQIKYELSLITE